MGRVRLKEHRNTSCVQKASTLRRRKQKDDVDVEVLWGVNMIQYIYNSIRAISYVGDSDNQLEKPKQNYLMEVVHEKPKLRARFGGGISCAIIVFFKYQRVKTYQHGGSAIYLTDLIQNLQQYKSDPAGYKYPGNEPNRDILTHRNSMHKSRNRFLLTDTIRPDKISLGS